LHNCFSHRIFRHSALAFVLAVSGVSAQSADEVLSRMDRAASGFRGVTAAVKKTSFTAVIKESSEETGRMSLYRPKPKDMRMLVQFSKPDERAVAFAGKKIQIYYPKLQTVQEYDLGKQSSLLDQFLLLGFGTPGSELKKSYEIKLLGQEIVSGVKCSHLELKPLSPDARAHIRQVELWIGETDGQPMQQRILQPSRDYTLITYSDLKVNPAGLSESSVKLNTPKGTKVERPQK
jgi:outer membrane lipoprotein-sorting protein